MFLRILCIGAGGFLGSISRYLAGVGLTRWLKPELLPVGTLVVNVIGCLVIGYLAGLKDWSQQNVGLAAFVMAGFLGGLTTFSSFGLETFQLIRGGHGGFAALNVLLNLSCGFLAVWCGFAAAKAAG